jgi:2-dehydropantoate 2-reductase
LQETFVDVEMSKISVAVWKEAFRVVSQAGIQLASLPGFPLERVTGLTSMPADEAAKVFSGVMMNLSKDPLYGSILQSIMRGKVSEIDFINGEFVRIAEENNDYAPLNKKLVEMVHRVELTREFYAKEELLSHVRPFLS